MLTTEMNEELKLLHELKARQEAATSLAGFARYALELEPARHHRILCSALDSAIMYRKNSDELVRCQQALERYADIHSHAAPDSDPMWAQLEQAQKGVAPFDDRIIICAPPAHAKSTYTSHLFPAYWLGHFPKDQIIAASHTADFATEIGRKVRNLVDSPRYGNVFNGLKIAEDSRAGDRWETNQGGKYVSVSVGGSVVGRRANLILIDDPYKSKEVAYRPSDRKRVSEWFFTDVIPRLLPGGVIILIQTRWHVEDLAGELLEKCERKEVEPYKLISFEAVCENPESDPLGREYGQALWPGFYPVDRLNTIKSGMDLMEWEALYQQKPRGLETGAVKTEWFKTYQTLPEDQYLYFTSWDTAGTPNEKADYSVGLAFAMNRKREFYLLDMYRKQASFDELMTDVPNFGFRNKTTTWLIENRGTGSSLIQVLRGRGVNIIPIQPQRLGSKEFRFELAVPIMEAGRVYIPSKNKAPWVSVFLHEILTFPGAYKDIADAFSQGLNHYGNGAMSRGMVKLGGYTT